MQTYRMDSTPRHSHSRLSRCLLTLVAAGAPLAPTAAARASSDEDDRTVIDARLEGLAENGSSPVDVSKPLGPGGTGGYWVLFVFLAALTAGVLFKDARRSHLD